MIYDYRYMIAMRLVDPAFGEDRFVIYPGKQQMYEA
jgi:hypothetical protein